MTKEDAVAIYDEAASNERGRLYDEMPGPGDVAQCNRVVAEAHIAGLLAVATEAARRERADVVAYIRGLLPHGVDDLARFIERGDHVGAAKGGA